MLWDSQEASCDVVLTIQAAETAVALGLVMTADRPDMMFSLAAHILVGIVAPAWVLLHKQGDAQQQSEGSLQLASGQGGRWVGAPQLLLLSPKAQMPTVLAQSCSLCVQGNRNGMHHEWQGMRVVLATWKSVSRYAMINHRSGIISYVYRQDMCTWICSDSDSGTSRPHKRGVWSRHSVWSSLTCRSSSHSNTTRTLLLLQT